MENISTKLAAHDIIRQLKNNNHTIRIVGAGLVFTYFLSYALLTLQGLFLIGVYLAWIYYANEKEIQRLRWEYIE